MITDEVDTWITTNAGRFHMTCFDDGTTTPPFILVLGEPSAGPILVRVQSECITGHVFSSLSCDCRGQLDDSLAMIAEAGSGAIIYLRQEGRGIGLFEKMRSYQLQNLGLDTVDANLELGHAVDEREYAIAANILERVGIKKIRLITNNPAKSDGLRMAGIEVAEIVPVPPKLNELNRRYLHTKADRMGHTYIID